MPSEAGEAAARAAMFSLHLVHVVADVEGAGAEGAKGLGSGLEDLGGDVVLAAGTFERGYLGHENYGTKAVPCPSSQILLRLASGTERIPGVSG
jgi:hypothetical protein